MSQLGGPGADIPEMSPSKYSWHGVVVKSILVAAPLRRSLISGCSLEPIYVVLRHPGNRLQLQHDSGQFNANPEALMAQQKTLWDQVDRRDDKEPSCETPGKDQSRRQVIKRLRGSGHWLTLLRVARTIRQPFTLNDISVAVWKACPDFFGMKGYPYPDNHKVHFILYGQRGLIAKGLIRRVQQGLFRVPEEVDPDALVPSEEDAVP
jgi:hypothetical protein